MKFNLFFVILCLFFIYTNVQRIDLMQPNSGRKICSHENAEDVSISGILVPYFDDMDVNKSHHQLKYFIQEANGDETKVEINEVDKSLYGKEIIFDGKRLQNKIIGKIQSLSNEKDYPIALAEINPIKYREEKMLIMFFKFNTSNRTYLSMPEAENLANSAFRSFYNQISDYKLKHTITVSGWHHLNRDEDDIDDVACFVTPQEVKDAAQEANIDLTQFDNVTMISNCSSYNTIGGRATLSKYDFLNIGKKMSWIKMASHPPKLAKGEHPYVYNWTSFVSILVHERGHNFGLMHSNGLDCGANTFLQNCQNIEYGNRFDRMGGPDGSYIFNAHQQALAGWKNEEKDFHHIKSNGVYTIDKLTSREPNRKIGAYIYDYKGEKKVFFLEYRTPARFDNNLSNWIFRYVPDGVHLYSNMGPSAPDKSPKISNFFRYIDAQPTKLDWHPDTAYESLTTRYVDNVNGIIINIQNVHNGKANVLVEYGWNERQCYKTTLKNKIRWPFITRYYAITEHHADIKFDQRIGTVNTVRNEQNYYRKELTLLPGDDFKVKYATRLSDHLSCPRSNIEFTWDNGDEFYSWVKPKPPKQGSGGAGSSSNGKDRPIGTGTIPGGNSNEFPLSRIFENYDQTLVVIPEMQVPADALDKDFLLHFTIRDTETNESFKYTKKIKVRSQREIYGPAYDPTEDLRIKKRKNKREKRRRKL